MKDIKKIFKRIFNPDGKNMIPKEQNVMDYLIMNGALEIVGIDSETNQFLYCFTPKLKEVMPELYSEHLNYVNAGLMALWEKGFVNIDFFAKDPTVNITKKAFIPTAIKTLTKEERWSLEEVKRLLKRREV
jgi:hypothetical protein